MLKLFTELIAPGATRLTETAILAPVTLPDYQHVILHDKRLEDRPVPIEQFLCDLTHALREQSFTPQPVLYVQQNHRGQEICAWLQWDGERFSERGVPVLLTPRERRVVNRTRNRVRILLELPKDRVTTAPV